MIIQITMTRNECFLLKELLPLWQKYADGFIFYNHFSTDDTVEFLNANKEKYNILEIIDPPSDLESPYAIMETNKRQKLFDEALKYTDKIICLDSDEYLDGKMSKQDLISTLNEQPNTVFYSQWVQYAGKNTLRTDGDWSKSFNDRVGNYQKRFEFPVRSRHSLHLPPALNYSRFNPEDLFIAHLQWIDKRWVGIKQYFYKVTDYVMHKEYGFTDIVGKEAYDNSVKDFAWLYSPAPVELKVSEDIYKTQDIKNNFKLKEIIKLTQQHDIPNLGDWGMGIYDYVKQCSKQDV